MRRSRVRFMSPAPIQQRNPRYVLHSGGLLFPFDVATGTRFLATHCQPRTPCNALATAAVALLACPQAAKHCSACTGSPWAPSARSCPALRRGRGLCPCPAKRLPHQHPALAPACVPGQPASQRHMAPPHSTKRGAVPCLHACRRSRIKPCVPQRWQTCSNCPVAAFQAL